jgi:hypothetical protein
MNHFETGLGDDPVSVKPQVAQGCYLSTFQSLPGLRGPAKLQVLLARTDTLCNGLAHEQVFVTELGVGFEAFSLKHCYSSKPESP